MDLVEAGRKVLRWQRAQGEPADDLRLASPAHEEAMDATEDARLPYILATFPKAEVQFICLARGDAELQRSKMKKAPDTP